MTNTVLIKRSSTANAVPTAGNLQPGELAINYNDGNLFYKNTSNVVTVIASNQFTSVSGNVTGGNLLTSGLISAGGSVTSSGITSNGVVDLTNSSNVSLGTIGNVHIDGGASGYILSTDGSGTLTWIGQTIGGSQITVDDFSGNGVQTQFTLSVTPPNIDSTTVNLNGVIQLRNTYSLSGANIIFGSAPANGSNIEITTISVNVTGAAGNNTQVQFNDSGSFAASSAFTFNNTTNTLSVTNLATSGTVSATGNVTGNYFLGNGAFLTGLPEQYGNANVAAYLASGTDTQNIVTSGNIVGGLFSTAGNIYSAHLSTTESISATGNIGTGGNINASGRISAQGNLHGFAISTDSQVSANGNVIAGNLITSGLISATGNIYINHVSAADGISATGNIGTAGAVNVSGSISAGGNVHGTNISVDNQVSANGNVIAGNVRTSGLISASGNITGAAGLFNNGLSVVGNITASGNLNYQNVTDLVVGDPLIFIGANNTSDIVDLGFVASANVNAVAQHLGFVRDHTDAVWKLFGNVVAEPTTVVDWTNAVYQPLLAGNISSTGNVTGNYFIGNGSQLTGLPEQYGNSNVAAYLASGADNQAIITSGNITGGNLLTNGIASAGGNVTGGNILTGGIVSSTGNVISLNVQTGNITSNFISAVGNITGANLNTGGLVSATGNISGSYLLGNGAFITGLPAGYANSNVAAYLASGTYTANVDFISSGNISLGNVGNVHITGGTSGYVLSTNGTGSLDWIASPSSNLTVDDFTGNGVQTEFTLSVTPSSIDNTTVNYDGIIQLRTGYTLSGANIVFASPPAAGSNIEVTTTSVYVATSVAGSNTQVQYNNAGALAGSAAFTFNNTTNAVSVGSLTGSRSNTTVTTSTAIDTFGTGTYRGAKYLIQGGNGTDYQASDVLLVHNGTDAYITISTVCSNASSDVFSVAATVNSGNVVLSATKIASGTVNVNLTVLYVQD